MKIEITQEELDNIIKWHKMWLKDNNKGKKAHFCLMRLDGFDLSELNLRGVDFTGASLNGTNLAGTDLIFADFSDASLVGANLKLANLHYANLYEANLAGANLSHATLTDQTNLADTNLSGANMIGINGIKFYSLDNISHMGRVIYIPSINKVFTTIEMFSYEKFKDIIEKYLSGETPFSYAVNLTELKSCLQFLESVK